MEACPTLRVCQGSAKSQGFNYLIGRDSKMKSIVSKVLVLGTCMAGVSGVFGFQESDTYGEEFDLYTKAEQETDQAKRRTILLEFVQTYQKSEVDPNVAYLYAQSYEGYRRGGQWQSMANAAERYLRHRPDDVSSIQAATEAYQKLGNPQKLVAFGAKLYEQSASANTAYFVAKAYLSFNDHANFQTWGKRTLRHDRNNVQVAVDLANSYWTVGNLPEAATYAKRGLESISRAKADPNTAAQMDQIRAFCYRAVGEAAHSTNNRTAALQNFEKSLEYDPKNDFAHYRLGYIHWAGGKVGPAMLSFAKSFVLNGPSSKDARTQLNQLHRQQGGRAGQISVIIRQARAAVK